MIPLKLQLKNFLSYGDSWTKIDFAPYNFICLSGKNGHGKSALLDAITWVLWGQARKISGVPRADDALVRLGQRHMAVIFDFICQGSHYVARRELILYQDRPKLTLDFGILDPQSQRIRPLTEKTIRLTQVHIQEVIGLDFESFTNSVFLRQGQSNEFSKKTAQERKQILTTILGIDQYEQMRKTALEKLKTLASEKEGVVKLQAHLRRECDRIGEVKKYFTECEQALIALQKQEDIYHNRGQVLQKRKLALAECKEALAAMQKDLDETKLKLQLYIHQRQLVFAQSEQEYEVAFAAKRIELQALTEKKEQRSSRLINLEREMADVEYQSNQLAHTIAPRDQCQQQLIAAQRLFEKRKELYQRMVAHGNWVHSERTIIKQQQGLTTNDDNAVCPLCQQTLSCDYRQMVQNQLAYKARFFEWRLRRLELFLQKSKQTLMNEHAVVKQHEQSLQQFAQASGRLDELKIRKNALSNELAVGRIELSTIVKTYEQEQIVHEALQKKGTQAKINAHERLSGDEQYRCFNDRIAELESKKQLLCNNGAFQDERAIAEQERTLDDEKKTVLDRKALLLQQRGRLMQELEHLESVGQQCEKYSKTIATLEAECADYELVAQVLGKDGIQALLIESVIPELEAEANEVLSRLSDQQARIFIESLRDLRTGGTRETLDINIADAVGIRPYELFSGGEAFRIDFALRIAISKLLARRAGASLQTLFIDEGFGSQDEEGLASIIEMLYKIQDCFAKIIIVSHLPFLKDQVPVQFMVEKLAHGSTVRVIEQG